jgi:hypothetical protein
MYDRGMHGTGDFVTGGSGARPKRGKRRFQMRKHARFRPPAIIIRVPVLALILAAAAARASAEVVDAADNGFTVRESVTVSIASDKAYATVIDIGKWWSPDHTNSRNAANLSIEAKPMGCFCEKLPDGGGVRFMSVVYAAPGKTLRLEGGIGPLQAMGLAGSMTWEFTAADKGTGVEVRYAVGGYHPGGFRDLATVVDRVLKEQLDRYKRFVETGKP